ncbi:YncE family protein [Longimicrobium sp.]|uniref:YncE family protein n=1 Tax=Longimicrobium sp. TaxID=2029185 RepID=UPI003B3B9F93
MKLLRHRAALAAVLMGAALFTACDSRNPFVPVPGPPDPTDPVAADSVRPTVAIVLPDTATDNVAVGDSVFVRARVTDNVAVETVILEGFAIRGSATLGTAVRVERFEKKTVDLRADGRLVRDTIIDRFLLATGDTVPEGGVFVVVTARDTADRETADTMQVNLGGPRISVTSGAAEYFAGTQMSVTINATDNRDLLSSVTLNLSGGMQLNQVIQFSSARAQYDTTIIIPIPLAARGDVRVSATTISGSNLVGVSTPVIVRLKEPDVDQVAPKATVQFSISERVEQQDSFSVQVTGLDENRVDSVGVTILAIRRDTVPNDTLRVFVGRGAVADGTFRFAFADLGLDPYGTFEVDLEITGWARDVQGNCGAATRENAPQELACVVSPAGFRLSTGAGRLLRVFVARGVTIDRPGANGTDVVADLVADSSRVYLSNYTQNRVDVLPLGGLTYGTPVAVGSFPWGLALGRTRDSLYVANSGGTNISVIPLRNATLREAQEKRIFTRNELLFGVIYDVESGEAASVSLHDYSDRPQFLAQTANGLLVYSTRPTAAAEDGTVRIYNPEKARSEIFTGYVDKHTSGRALVVNADSAFYAPPSDVVVCPRRRFGDTENPPCITGFPRAVSDSLTKLRALPANQNGARYDTRLDIGADVREVGFSDTTFVAASTDRRFVAVGEGVRENARIPLFEALGDSLVMRGDVRDLISNAAERVIGLGINRDGTLGVARGQQAYFFNEELRLQGVMESGSPTGGVALHPEGGNYLTGDLRLAFVSGSQGGRPYVAVLNTFNFCELARVYTRDPVTGALALAPRAPGDPANVDLRLYALTSTGVLSLPITKADLASRPPLCLNGN